MKTQRQVGKKEERTAGCAGRKQKQLRWFYLLFPARGLVRILMMYIGGCKLVTFELDLGMDPAGTVLFKF